MRNRQAGVTRKGKKAGVAAGVGSSSDPAASHPLLGGGRGDPPPTARRPGRRARVLTRALGLWMLPGLLSIQILTTTDPAGAEAGTRPTLRSPGPPLAGSTNEAFGVGIEPGGKVVAVGVGPDPTLSNDFEIAQYDRNGGLDPSFGVGGRVTLDFGGSDFARAVAIQRDGKIVVAGYTDVSGSFDFALARVSNLDGTVEFMASYVDLFFAGAPDLALGVAIQADGKIVVAGQTFSGSVPEFGVARLTAWGAIDPAFAPVATAIGFAAGANAVAVYPGPEPRIVAAGYTFVGTSTDFALARYTAAGALDVTFGGGDGIVTTDFALANDVSFGVAVQGAGKVVAAGSAYMGPGKGLDFGLARYTDAGALDTGFDADGKVTTDSGTGGADQGFGVALQGSRIVVAGWSFTGTASDVAVARYRSSDGAPDLTFGGDGLVTTDVDLGDDQAHAVAVAPNNRVVVAGGAIVAGGEQDFVVARYLSGGSLDSSFAGDGLTTTDF